MWVFQPAIWKASVLTELPRPVTSLRILDSWDFEKFKTPLADGDVITGHSRNGVDLQVEGQFGSVAGTLKIDEPAMLQAVMNLRGLLHVDGAAARFGLVLYHDADSGQSRYFANCSTVRFDCDLSDPALFTYSILIHSSSPTIVTAVLSA
jgi:hypothetical protein